MGNVLFYQVETCCNDFAWMLQPISRKLYYPDCAASIGIRLRCQEPVEPEQRI